MERKSNTVFRNVAIAGVIILAIVGFSFFTGDDRDYAEVDTSVALAQVDAGNVKEALIEDREQQLRLTLETPIAPEDGADETDKLLAKYPERAADQVFDRVAFGLPLGQTAIQHRDIILPHQLEQPPDTGRRKRAI